VSYRTSIAALAAIGSLTAISAPALAQDTTTPVKQRVTETMNGGWVSLSGKVVSATPHQFMLDYGAKTIPVEMDNYKWYNENVLLPGDKVTVTGRMDNDFFQDRRIEAASVYVNDLHRYFYASPADEEDGYYTTFLAIDPITNHESVSLSGTVSAVDGEIMTLDTGLQNFRVDTGTLGYDPFDSTGLEEVAVGDHVVVSGRMDDGDLFDSREIDATGMTKLSMG
jgi:uncharacterized protein YdeI (BOF family)